MSKPRVPARRVAIALPTGVLLPGALRILGRSGVARLSATELGRKLLVERPAVRVVLVRPADVPAYVDHGAADLGIVGKDVLWESPGAHYELADLRFGGCRLVLAVPAASKLAGRETWPPLFRVAAVLGTSTARLIANQASLKTRTDAVQSMVARLRAATDQPAARVRAAS